MHSPMSTFESDQIPDCVQESLTNIASLNAPLRKADRSVLGLEYIFAINAEFLTDRKDLVINRFGKFGITEDMINWIHRPIKSDLTKELNDCFFKKRTWTDEDLKAIGYTRKELDTAGFMG
eukprot:UN27097